MQMILGITESSWVDIGVVVVPMCLGALGIFIFLKIKSVKTDIMIDVKKEIGEEIAPLIKSMDEYEKDFKEFKKDELEPIKKDINDIKREQDVMNSILNTLVKTLDRNHLEIKDLMRDRDKNHKENFILLFEKLEKKQDKK